jgi:uncharacterized membrane protein
LRYDPERRFGRAAPVNRWPIRPHHPGLAIVDAETLLLVALRWMHIFGASIAIGGTVFMRLALLPTVGELAEDARRALHEGVSRRWALYVRIAIAFLLISGIHTVATKMSTVPVLYHILFTFKLVAALGVFFIASALTGRSPALAAMRNDRKKWLTINLWLVLGIVLVSGALRAIPPKAAKSPQAVLPVAGASQS